MIQRKKKQIVYNTEGDNYIRHDFNIKSSNPSSPIEPLEPKQPLEPGIPKTIPKYIPSDYPNGYKNDTNQRPGGIDPYYRSVDTTKRYKPPSIFIPGSQDQRTVQRTSDTNQRPGGIDPYYSYVNKETYKETNPFIKAMTEPNISDAEGLKRAYESKSNTYMFKGVLYVAGTKGGVFGSDMIENVKYIGIPNIESAIVSNVTQLAKTATTVLFPGEQLAANIGFGIDMAAERYSMKDEMKDLTPAIESLTRFKDAEQAYLANKDYIQRVVGDSSGGAVIEALKSKYPDIIGGNGYGSPIVDVFGRSKIKGFLQNEREARNAGYGDKWFNKPEKMVNNVYQDVVETALGLDGIKTTKDTGIEQHRTAFDPVASLNNSATTTFSSISDVLSKNTLTHSYELTASNISTSKDSSALADGYITKDGTPVMFQ